MISNIKDFLEEYWIFILVPVLIVGFLIYLFYPRNYILDVRQIQWEYVVHIEEFMVQHHSGDRSKPYDAYNVKSHYHPKTKTWTDEDGKTHTKDDSYWTELRSMETVKDYIDGVRAYKYHRSAELRHAEEADKASKKMGRALMEIEVEQKACEDFQQ